MNVIRMAELKMKQEKIDAEKFRHQREYEFQYQFQEKYHLEEMERLEAQRAMRLPPAPRETNKARHQISLLLSKVKTRWTLNY